VWEQWRSSAASPGPSVRCVVETASQMVSNRYLHSHCESLHPRGTHLTVVGSQLWSICALRCHHSCQCPGQLSSCRRHPAFSTKAAEKDYAAHTCSSHYCNAGLSTVPWLSPCIMEWH